MAMNRRLFARAAKSDEDFLQSRRPLNRFGKVAMPALVVGWTAFGVWGFFRSPSLFNPIHAARQIEAGTANPQDLALAAVLLPVVGQILFWTVLAFLLLAWVWNRLEARYLRLVEQRRPDQGSSGGSAP